MSLNQRACAISVRKESYRSQGSMGSGHEQMPQGRDQFYQGSSVANPDASPILNNVVELLLLEHDRIQIL